MQLLHDPVDIAEDDRLRSIHVRELVQNTPPVEAPSEPVIIPKVIVQFWHDWDAIPTDVCECLDSWESLTLEGFERALFDDHTARRFIARRFGGPYVAALDRCRHPAMRCDYFRLCYIFRFGGFYLDADEVYQGADCQYLFRDNKLKIQPLCYDTVAGAMVQADAFMKHRAYSPDWIFYTNNNPILAPPCHPVIGLALARSTRLLLNHPNDRLDIQSTTGPGNLTASLVRHSVASKRAGKAPDFLLLTNWEAMSISRWPLSYRDDERNWRLWNPTA